MEKESSARAQNNPQPTLLGFSEIAEDVIVFNNCRSRNWPFRTTEKSDKERLPSLVMRHGQI